MNKKIFNIIIKIALIVLVGILSSYGALYILLLGLGNNINGVIVGLACFIIPLLLLPFLFKNIRKKFFIFSSLYSVLVILAVIVNVIYINYGTIKRCWLKRIIVFWQFWHV